MSDLLRLRVRVLEAWEDVDLPFEPTTPFSVVKRRVLDAVHLEAEPDAFLVKFRGAEVTDESRTLAELQVPPDGALIVMRRRRMPVR